MWGCVFCAVLCGVLCVLWCFVYYVVLYIFCCVLCLLWCFLSCLLYCGSRVGSLELSVAYEVCGVSSAWCRIESVAPPACGIVHQALSILGQSVPPCVACTCCLVSCPWRLAAVHHFGFTETVEQQQQRTVHQLPMCCWPDRKGNCCQKTAAETVSYILSLCADRQQQERLCQLHCLSLCVDRSNCCQCQTSTTKTVSVTCLSLCVDRSNCCHC